MSRARRRLRKRQGANSTESNGASSGPSTRLTLQIASSCAPGPTNLTPYVRSPHNVMDSRGAEIPSGRQAQSSSQSRIEDFWIPN